MPYKPGDRVPVHNYMVTYRRDDRADIQAMRVGAFNKRAAMDRVSDLMAMRRVTGEVIGAQYLDTTTALVLR